MVGERAERTIPRLTNAWRWTGPPAGKRGMVRVGGSASQTISDMRSERDGGHRAPLGYNVSAPRRGMRPAGINGPARRIAPVGGSDVKGSSAIQPLSVEAVEFSPALVPEKNIMSGRKTEPAELPRR